MALTYGGVTPQLIVDTRALQGTETVSPEGRKLVRNRDGVCASMVMDWIKKCHEIPGGVTDISQLKSGLALSLAQAAYERGSYDAVDSDSSFVGVHGLNLNVTNVLHKKKLSFKKSRYQRVAAACAGLVGYAWISIRGNGGHALGYRQNGGVIQFLDPNEGILQFNSAVDFVRWFPSYIKREYPALLDEIEMRVIRH